MQVDVWYNTFYVHQNISHIMNLDVPSPGLDKGITLGNCLLEGLSGLKDRETKHKEMFFPSKNNPSAGGKVIFHPDLIRSLQSGGKGCF